jgi:glycosyltransferase involved in cell wall biosynthesis
MLSIAIITLNEEKNIKKCIESVKDISDDIVVVDSFSSDRTCEIAEKLGAKLVKRGFDDFSSQKNFAVSNCKYDWILSLDADEIVSDKLKDEIKKLDLKNTEFSGFLIKRKGSTL